jgi:hypothetical protein
MKQLECIIFNVEHGFCAFIKSPNNYGLMIDCGGRENFSPIKWIRQHYNYGKGNIQYHQGRRIAEMIITHLHMDHFSDIGSFVNREDRPKILLRDRRTLKFIDEKIEEEKEGSSQQKVLKQFKKFQSSYTLDVEKKVDWGFDFFKHSQISYKDAEDISKDRDKIINNRSYITSIEYAGRKILFPGDIETAGWDKAFNSSYLLDILEGTDFFVTSHHGRQSGCNSDMLDYTGKPYIYIVSARARDEGTYYSFYSRRENSYGYFVSGDSEPSRVISTKRRSRSIKIIIDEKGRTAIIPIVTPDNLTKNQQRLAKRRTKMIVGGWNR